jgi:hypothetical protein
MSELSSGYPESWNTHWAGTAGRMTAFGLGSGLLAGAAGGSVLTWAGIVYGTPIGIAYGLICALLTALITIPIVRRGLRLTQTGGRWLLLAAPVTGPIALGVYFLLARIDGQADMLLWAVATSVVPAAVAVVLVWFGVNWVLAPIAPDLRRPDAASRLGYAALAVTVSAALISTGWWFYIAAS